MQTIEAFGLTFDARTCKMGRRHLFKLTDTTDKYEDQYPVVVHEVCVICTMLRHTLCHASGARIALSPLRYDPPDGYKEIAVTGDDQAQWNLDRFNAVRNFEANKRAAQEKYKAKKAGAKRSSGGGRRIRVLQTA